MAKEENILIFCGHSDDESIGAGGTIAKLVSEGKKIIKIVFSYGEGSHPHFQESVVIGKRIEETEIASKFLGIEKNIFFGLRDTKVREDAEKSNIVEKVKSIIGEYRPVKIFIPSAIDPHPDHKAVNATVLKAVDSLRKKYPVFEYEVWNVLRENKPFFYVDITPFYKKKLKYMKYFSSQWQYIYFLWLPVYFRSRSYGRKNRCKFAEKFYKVR